MLQIFRDTSGNARGGFRKSEREVERCLAAEMVKHDIRRTIHRKPIEQNGTQNILEYNKCGRR